jgi:AcrR family transcriptional regulator
MVSATARARARTPTSERILDEVERLIAVKGVFGFTLRDVAGPLNVQVPAIYKHFESRDDVLVEVSRHFIGLLAQQFSGESGRPVTVLRNAVNSFVEFMMSHPAYVRLALVDFATPGGGMEYVKRAAGGSFLDNFSGGALAPMHARLRRMLAAGTHSRKFRRVDPSDFYRVVKSALLIRLVFPDDVLLLRKPTRAEIRAVQLWLWDIAARFLEPRARPQRRRIGRARDPAAD